MRNSILWFKLFVSEAGIVSKCHLGRYDMDFFFCKLFDWEVSKVARNLSEVRIVLDLLFYEVPVAFEDGQHLLFEFFQSSSSSSLNTFLDLLQHW